jgi:hypothetical protein
MVTTVTEPRIWVEQFDLNACDRRAFRAWYDSDVLLPRSHRHDVRFVRRGRGVADPLAPAAANDGIEIAVYDLSAGEDDGRWALGTETSRDAAIDGAYRAGSGRMYRQLSSTLDPYRPPTAEILHGGFFEVSPEHQAEFNAWYEREHIAEQLRVPGYLTVRRFQGEHDRDRFVALYDVATIDSIRSAEAARALSSRWGDRVRSLVISRARRLFEVERQEFGAAADG